MIIKIKQIEGLQSALDSKVSGTGNINFLAKWSSTTGIIDSQLQDDGTSIGIGNSPDSEG